MDPRQRGIDWIGFGLRLGACVLVACGSDKGGATDAGLPDGPPPDAPSITGLKIDETVTVPGLSAPVDVVRDVRGTPHIYGQNMNDVVRVEGYLMARDRFPQMEFIRRGVLGRLSEFAGTLVPSLLTMDISARVAGFAREGQAIYASLSADDPTKLAVDAFVAGVNQYIAEIKAAPDKSKYIPRGAEEISLLYNSPAFGPWQPSDIFAFARYQATSLSFDTTDIDSSRALAGVQAAFGTDPSTNRRAGAFVDMYGFWPARRAYTVGGPGAAKPARHAAATPRKRRPTQLPGLAQLDAARRFAATEKRLLGLVGDRANGSNNWMVSGAHTASGHPLLANDPHLPLYSPPIWWYVHVNTKRAGGDVNAMGVTFAGAPGVVLGFNENIAWGATVTFFDVTDIYDETLTPGSPDTVTFNGTQVPTQTVNETIPVAGNDPMVVPVEIVPHHGYIIPGTKQNGHALSVRYIGSEPSNELAYFWGLLTAKNVDEARAAQLAFKVGSQNFIVAAKDGDISWSTISRVPVRDPRARDLAISADGIVTGHCPTFILPGDGPYEWTGDIDPQQLPADRNPAKGFISTANNDSIGVTDDGNPCNDAQYLSGRYDLGWREARIAQRLTALVQRGNVTADDLSAVQAETESSLGETLRDPMVASLGHVIAANDGTFTADELADLADVRARLMAWTFATPPGVGATDAGEIADSVATTLFDVGVTRIIPRAFGDEAAAVGVTPGSQRAAALLERAMVQPSTLATYDAAIGDTVLWDDLTTTGKVETRDEIVARGFLDALAFIRAQLGTDASQWRWGRLHKAKFTSLPPVFAGTDVLSLPPDDDPTFPGGYPRHGDFGAPDASDPDMGIWAPTSFVYSHGPSQRLVVELMPDGPRARNALPGGQSFDPDSPHHADEAQLWIKNQAPPVFFTEAEVVTHAEARQRFMPQ